MWYGVGGTLTPRVLVAGVQLHPVCERRDGRVPGALPVAALHVGAHRAALPDGGPLPQPLGPAGAAGAVRPPPPLQPAGAGHALGQRHRAGRTRRMHLRLK